MAIKLGLALLASAFLAAACDSGDRRPPAAGERRCEVGAERAGLAAGEPAIVLGCGRTRTGIAVELLAERDAAGPCLSIAGLPGGRRACGRTPSERVPAAREAIGGGAIVRASPRAELELYGETAPSVRRVHVRYRLPHGRAGQRRMTLIRATDPAALRAAGIRAPFGYFLGAVPARARRVSAMALDRSGEIVGRLGFDRLARHMPPRVFIAVRE